MKKNEFIYYVAIIASIVYMFGFLQPVEVIKKNDMKKEFLSSGINLDYMDTTISPKDDFYRFVNGAWLDSAKIPSDQSVWGSFYQLDKETNKDVLALMESALNDKGISRTSDQGKAVSMYECFMDLEHRNKLGINPILPYLKQVDLINDITSLQGYMEETSKHGAGSDFLGIYVSTDKKNSQKHSAYLYGGNLGLPDRDYYLLESFSDIRSKYLFAFPMTKLFS